MLVGELNPYGGDPHFALYCEPSNSAGGRMCRKVLAIPRRDYLHLERYNLCVGRWSPSAARKAAEKIRAKHAGECLVLLGRKVAATFGCALPHFSSYDDEHGRPTIVLLPHPSGRCQRKGREVARWESLRVWGSTSSRSRVP